MKTVKQLTAVLFAITIIGIGACNSSKHHWHKTTKEEREMKKGK